MYITFQKASCRSCDLLREILTTPLSLLLDFNRSCLPPSSFSPFDPERFTARPCRPAFKVISHFPLLSVYSSLAHLTQQRRSRDLGSVQRPSKNWTPNPFSFHASDFDSTKFTSVSTPTSALTEYHQTLLISDAVTSCDVCLKTLDFVLNEQRRWREGPLSSRHYSSNHWCHRLH
jgi:hypothetical protein